MPRDWTQGLGFLLGFWVALFLSPMSVEVTRASGGEPFGAEQIEAQLHVRVNAVRSERNLIELERRSELDAIARAHSADMAARGFFSHTNPDGLGPVERFAAGARPGYTLGAENIGRTSELDPPEAIVRGWLNSAVHRRNLYSAPFNATGIGATRAPDGSWIVTQIYLGYPR